MKRECSRGYTILELLVGIALLSGLIGFIGRFYISAQGRNYQQERLSVALQAWMRACEQLQFDLKSATEVTSPNTGTLQIAAVKMDKDLALQRESISWRQESEKIIIREASGKSTRFDFSDGLERKQKLTLDFTLYK